MSGESPIASRFVLPSNPVIAILTAAAAGALWGAVARVWMRFISAEYEFSWGGTLAIVAIFAVFGLGQGVSAVARRSGWPMRGQFAARIFAIVATVPLGMAAGAPMLPPTLLAATAVGRTNMNRNVRLVLAALAVVPTLLVFRQLIDELELWRAIVGWKLMFVIYAPLVWALSRSLRPFDGREVEPELGPEAAHGELS